MSRKFKTAKKNRTTYRYYNADGTVAVELRPGEDGVTEADIGLLHSIDDTEVDAERREAYRICANIDAGYGDDGPTGAAPDLNPYLADESADPQKVLDEREEERERAGRLARLDALIGSLSTEQLELYEALFVRQMPGRRLAAREGVTEGTIRKRKNTLFNSLREKL
jgi:DNA-directed RNA polymerase specialized sigma24 family protein